jgi:hypothetical protein
MKINNIKTIKFKTQKINNKKLIKFYYKKIIPYK